MESSPRSQSLTHHEVTAPLSQQEVAEWFEWGTFTTDWTSPHFPLWMNILRPLRDRPADVLEIGSWEGRSALFFLNYLPQARMVCVDPFTGNAIHRNNPELSEHLSNLEGIFDANVAAFADRVEKLKAASSVTLPSLALSGRRFDLAFVDGCHRAADVFSDAALVWPLMLPGAVVIFDDYELAISDDEHERPKLGLDAFRSLFKGQYNLLHEGWQLILQKN
jgi:predicted O-methyltransferase YrrM